MLSTDHRSHHTETPAAPKVADIFRPYLASKAQWQVARHRSSQQCHQGAGVPAALGRIIMAASRAKQQELDEAAVIKDRVVTGMVSTSRSTVVKTLALK